MADSASPVAADFGQQININLGRAIRDRRAQLDLTQSRLAEDVGLSRASIANIEAGEQAISVVQLLRFASALSTTAEALLAAARDGWLAAPTGELPAAASDKLHDDDEQQWVLGLLPNDAATAV